MLIRRGVSALVPAGAPYMRNQAPLIPTIIQTIAGVEREGGRFGVTANPVFPPLIGRGPRFQRGVGGRGLGAVLQGTFTNLTTGKSYPAPWPPGGTMTPEYAAPIFKTGDRYRVAITGAEPNGGIDGVFVLNSTFSGYSGQIDPAMSIWLGRETRNLDQPLGQADAFGNWSMSGVFTDAMAGNWYQAYGNGQASRANSSFIFNSAKADAVVPTAQINMDLGPAYYQQASNQVPTQAAPTATVQTLAQQLAAANLTMLPTGQLVTTPPPSASGAGASTGGAGGSGAAGGAATPGTGGSIIAPGGALTIPGTFDIGSFLTGSAFLGLPNWILLAAAAGAVVLLGSKK